MVLHHSNNIDLICLELPFKALHMIDKPSIKIKLVQEPKSSQLKAFVHTITITKRLK